MEACPLRWLLIATHVPASGKGGGMVRYVVELARALHRRDDVELHALALPAAKPFFEELLGDPVRVHATPDLPVPLLSLLERSGWLRQLHQQQWDVVQGAKHLLPRVPAGRRVLTVHDMLVLDRPQDFRLVKRALLRRPFLASIRDAHTLIAVSRATRERLLQHVPHVAPRVTVVGHATVSNLSKVRSVSVQELQGRVFGLVVGDPSPRKNLRFALSVWQEVARSHPNALLAVVGPPGWGVSDLSGEDHSGQAVRRLGHITDEELRWCYEHASVVLCPSLHEGYGLPAVEALELGAPVITSTDAALVEASGDSAVHLQAQGQAAIGPWVVAVRRALDRPRSPSNQVHNYRTWDDVASDTVRAVKQTTPWP